MSATADVSALLREAEKHGSAVVPCDTLLAIIDAAEHHKSQRDALLAALERIAEDDPFSVGMPGRVARAAIAKARGEA